MSESVWVADPGVPYSQMKLRLFVAACAMALLAGCGLHSSPARKPARANAAPTLPAGMPDLSAYRLGIGDKVRIDVFGEPDLSIEAFVDGTGHIGYPLLGAVLALQKTAAELREVLTTGLAGGYLVDPDVRVTVVQYRPFYTIGQVRRPGSYAYVIGLTVEKALAIAGGLTDLASTRHMFLLREDTAQGKRIKVGLDALVLPGDTLLVEEGLF
jgi:polysaccharide biosynthesis/export protein VpsN